MSVKTRLQRAYNSMFSDIPSQLGKEFFRRGNPMYSDWSRPVMLDEDYYTGYLYGAIDRRANSVAEMGLSQLRTEIKGEKVDEIHPYVEVIRNSTKFSETDFYYVTSTYLDLKGLMYLAVIRGAKELSSGVVYGKPKEFELLNPYEVQPVLDSDQLSVVGYVETRNGMQREWPVEMIIPINKFNPFKRFDGYPISKAARESQFTLKQSSDHTRSSLQHNIDAPGIITTAARLDDKTLENFKERLRQKLRGEPIIGTGGDTSVKWQDMQIELDKAALPSINQISLDQILAVSATSRTTLGIEQSGTTRETAKTQKDNLIDFGSIPQLQNIIDALNLDFKIAYSGEYAVNKTKIFIDNPLKTDKDAEMKDVEIRSSSFTTYSDMISKGYDPVKCAQYLAGDIDLEKLGKPTTPVERVEEPEEEEKPPVEDDTNNFINEALNASGPLKNAVMNVDAQLIGAIIDKLTEAKNAYTEDELLGKPARKRLLNELEMVLEAFYSIVFTSYGQSFIQKTAQKFALVGNYQYGADSKKYARTISKKAATSHIDTILESAMKLVNERALAGDSIETIVSALTSEYSDQISQARAEVIARTETSRAFNMTQYDADRQFIAQNKLEGTVYKQWRTHSTNPCAFCLGMQNRGLIPFENDFASIGDTLTASAEVDGEKVVKTMNITFDNVKAGVLHPNCSCDYEIILK